MSLFTKFVNKKDTIEITDIRNSTITLNINDVETIQDFIVQNNHNISNDVKDKINEVLLSAREYNYNIIKSYNEIMLLNNLDYQDLIDFPILNDIENENSLVYFDNTLINVIENSITSPLNRRFLIKGAGGRGKTVLSRLFAYKKKHENWEIYFIDIREVSESDITTMTVEIEKRLNVTTPILFIVENSHCNKVIDTHFIE